MLDIMAILYIINYLLFYLRDALQYTRPSGCVDFETTSFALLGVRLTINVAFHRPFSPKYRSERLLSD